MNVAIVNGIELEDVRDVTNPDRILDMVILASEDGKFEPETFEYIDTVEPKTFVDVGSYNGIYSIYCAKNFCASCLAFEPNVRNWNLTLNNVIRNKVFNNIQTQGCALSNRNSRRQFFTNPSTQFTSAGSLVSDKKKPQIEEVDAMTFDSVYYPNKPIELIKIDVEGHELEVLQGMAKTLNRDKPNLIIECLADVEFHSVKEFLKEFGYEYIKNTDIRNNIFEVKQ
jgi:FkbM family methyltransferase